MVCGSAKSASFLSSLSCAGNVLQNRHVAKTCEWRIAGSDEGVRNASCSLVGVPVLLIGPVAVTVHQFPVLVLMGVSLADH